MRITITKYDLTRGMANTFSHSILAKPIEGIWHTGVIIDNHEYFYGNGIQRLEHSEFIKLQNNLFPCETFDYGDTNRSIGEIEEFISNNNEVYSIDKYNLIEHNCNHFTNKFSKFLVDRELPNDIVNQASDIMSFIGGFFGGFFKKASEEFHKSNCKLIKK